jgi:hypothetical protein
MTTADTYYSVKSGLLLNSIRTASSANASSPRYSKLDNTGYTFVGRSYGAGSGVGLVEDPFPSESGYHGTLRNYSFAQPGFTSSVTCIYNQTSDLLLFELGTFPTPDGYYAPTGYWANGSLPIGDWFGFPAWGVVNNATIFAMAAIADPTTNRSMYGLISGTDYPRLNQIQCDVSFSPTMLSVTVDTQARMIEVAPNITANQQTANALNQSLAVSAFFQPSSLAQMMTTMYTSSMGNAFSINADNVRIRNNHTTATDEDWLAGVSEGLELLLDHTFDSVGAAQIMLHNETNATFAQLSLSVLRLGDPRYTYSILGISVAMLLLAILDAIRTQFWHDLPILNVLDIKSAILSVASLGGVEDRKRPGSLSDDSVLQKWDGNAASRAVGTIHVVQQRHKPHLRLLRLDRSGRGTVISLDNDASKPMLAPIPSSGPMEIP